MYYKILPRSYKDSGSPNYWSYDEAKSDCSSQGGTLAMLKTRVLINLGRTIITIKCHYPIPLGGGGGWIPTPSPVLFLRGFKYIALFIKDFTAFTVD